MSDEALLTYTEAGALLGVTERTIQTWVATGVLPREIVEEPRLGYRIPREAVERLVAERAKEGA